MNPLVIGIDPGKTTGVCIARLPTARPEEPEAGTRLGEIEVINAYEILWDFRLEDIEGLFSTPPGGRVEAVVIESFHLYPDKAEAQIGSSFPSVQIIGIVEAMMHIYLPKFQPARICLVPAGNHKSVAILDTAPTVLNGNSAHIKDAYQLARLYQIALRNPVGRPRPYYKHNGGSK
jgi:hypothetical protein